MRSVPDVNIFSPNFLKNSADGAVVKSDCLFSFHVGVISTKWPKGHKAYFSSQFPVAVHPGGALQEPEAAGRIIPTTRRRAQRMWAALLSFRSLLPVGKWLHPSLRQSPTGEARGPSPRCLCSDKLTTNMVTVHTINTLELKGKDEHAKCFRQGERGWGMSLNSNPCKMVTT